MVYCRSGVDKFKSYRGQAGKKCDSEFMNAINVCNSVKACAYLLKGTQIKTKQKACQLDLAHWLSVCLNGGTTIGQICTTARSLRMLFRSLWGWGSKKGRAVQISPSAREGSCTVLVRNDRVLKRTHEIIEEKQDLFKEIEQVIIKAASIFSFLRKASVMNLFFINLMSSDLLNFREPNVNIFLRYLTRVSKCFPKR